MFSSANLFGGGEKKGQNFFPHTGLIFRCGTDGVDIVGENSLIESPPGTFYWPSAPEIIAVTGVDNAVYDAEGVGKTFASAALALAALVSLEDGVRLVGGTKGAGMWNRDLTEAESRRSYRYFDGAIGETPAAFSFTDVTGVELSTVTESDAITVSSILFSVPFTVSGGEAEKNDSGVWVTSGTVVATDTIKVRATSSASYETPVNVVLNINGVSDTFTVTTRAEVTIRWADGAAILVYNDLYWADGTIYEYMDMT